MKACLNCQKEYEAKRETSKFCSTSCRVRWHQKNPKAKSKVTEPELREMFNAVLGAVNSINAQNGQPAAVCAIIVPEKPKEAILSYNELRDLIESATSSAQLHAAWKQVEKNKNLVGWQLRELSKLKDHQQTKIDF